MKNGHFHFYVILAPIISVMQYKMMYVLTHFTPLHNSSKIYKDNTNIYQGRNFYLHGKSITKCNISRFIIVYKYNYILL